MFGHRVTGYTRQDRAETGVWSVAEQWRSCGLNIEPLEIDGLQNNVKKLIFAKNRSQIHRFYN